MANDNDPRLNDYMQVCGPNFFFIFQKYTGSRYTYGLIFIGCIWTTCTLCMSWAEPVRFLKNITLNVEISLN